MQYINHWPDVTEPALPETVTQELFEQRLQPFNSEGEAKEFWQETPSTLIILDHSDSIEGSEAGKQIVFTLTYQEYTSISRERK